MKKLTAIILTLLLALALTACGSGSGASTDPNVGLYNCTDVEMMGISMSAEEVFDGAATLELKDGGKGEIDLGGTTSSLKWTLDGTALSVDFEGETSTGTLENGVIMLDMIGLGLNATFVKEGAQPPAAAAEKTEAAEQLATGGDWAAAADFWSGDWYGWWIVGNCTGNFSDWEDDYYDCCATITMGSDGVGSIEIWDEDLPKGDGVAETTLTLETGAGENGMAVSKGGWFMDGDLADGTWEIDPILSGYDRCLYISGTYTTERGSFDYIFTLKPWGDTWEDVLADDPTGAPKLYESWYLPLIQTGAAMPDTIG